MYFSHSLKPLIYSPLYTPLWALIRSPLDRARVTTDRNSDSWQHFVLQQRFLSCSSVLPCPYVYRSAKGVLC